MTDWEAVAAEIAERLRISEADNAALREQIARAIRLYPQFAERFADAMREGKG